MSELKPCPFCNSENIAPAHNKKGWKVKCLTCESGFRFDKKSDAEMVWNTRPSPWIEIKSADDLPPVNSKFIVQVTGGYVDFVKFTMQDDIMPLFVGESEQYLLSDLVRFFSIPQPPKAEGG